MTRRRVLQGALAWTLAAPFAGLLGAMVRRLGQGRAPTCVQLPGDLPDGLTVVGPVIAHRGQDGSLRAFAARCSHLGCTLDRVVGEEVVCACHGSRYRADGSVLQGPAARPLTALPAQADSATGGWTVHVET